MSISFNVTELGEAATQLRAEGGRVSNYAVPIPVLDPQAYGSLVGSAAAMAEPSTSESNKEFIQTLGAGVADLGERLKTTAERYDKYETSVVDLINSMEWD